MQILLVEDDRILCEFLEQLLRRDGHCVTISATGLAGLEALRTGEFDLMILDRMLPELDGMRLLQQVRGEGFTLPVLMLTALGTPADKVEGLDAGADDYLAKPFDAAELLARLRALARSRSGGYGVIVRCGDVALDAAARLLTGPVGGCEVSGRESALLAFLFRNAGQVLPRELLLDRVWGADSEVEEGNLNNYIFFARRRLLQVAAVCRFKRYAGWATAYVNVSPTAPPPDATGSGVDRMRGAGGSGGVLSAVCVAVHCPETGRV